MLHVQINSLCLLGSFELPDYSFFDYGQIPMGFLWFPKRLSRHPKRTVSMTRTSHCTLDSRNGSSNFQSRVVTEQTSQIPCNYMEKIFFIFSDRSKRRERVRTELIKAGTKQKKGFMTPERKKKLRVRTFVGRVNQNCNRT